jgi:hypothetical protein
MDTPSKAALPALVFFLSMLLPAGPLCGQSLDSLQFYHNTMFQDVVPPTGFLWNRGFVFHNRIEPFILADGSDLSQRVIITTASKWRQLYSYARASRIGTSFSMPSTSVLQPSVPDNDPQVPIGLLFLDGNYVDPGSADSFFNEATKKVLPNVPQQVVNIFAVSTLRDRVANKNVVFEIDPDRIFINRPEPIIGLSIDFDDGTGPHLYSLAHQTIAVAYASTGPKSLQFKLITALDTLVCYSTLRVRSKSGDGSTAYSIEVELPDGTTTKASYQIDLGCDQVLDRPFIVIEGFDATDRVDVADSYDKYAGVGILNDLNQHGYDFIGVQFHRNNDFLQYNALLLKAIIQKINAEKTGHFENIIVGESMGGIITRIALKQLEDAGIDPEVRLYVSFDSPHGGAAIPVSIQQFGHDLLEIDVNDFLSFLPDFLLDWIPSISIGDGLQVAGIFSESAEDAYRSIQSNDSPAARQMLVRHYEYRTALNPDHLAFKDYLQTLGYPQASRNVALINGSSNATEPMFTSDKYINYSYTAGWFDCIADINIQAYVSPVDAHDFTASRIQAEFLCGTIGPNKSTKFDFFDKQYDSCPGSSKSVDVLDDNKFSFVPTVHSIDLRASAIDGPYGLHYYDEASANPVRRKKYMVEHGLTPFNDIYGQAGITGHIRFEGLEAVVERLNTREFMLDHQYWQNKSYGSGKVRQFFADRSVTVGRDVNPWPDKEIEPGNFTVEPGAQIKVTAGQTIRLRPGFRVEEGAQFAAFIQPSPPDCAPGAGNRPGQAVAAGARLLPYPVLAKTVTGSSCEVRVLNPCQFAKSEDYHWTLRGNGITAMATGYRLVVTDLPPGQYVATCDLFAGQRAQSELVSIVTPTVKPAARRSTVAAPPASDRLRLAVWPNPAVERVNVAYALPQAERVKFELTDTYGRRVYSVAPVELPVGPGQTTLPVESLAAGTYYLTVTAGMHSEVRRLVIQR